MGERSHRGRIACHESESETGNCKVLVRESCAQNCSEEEREVRATELYTGCASHARGIAKAKCGPVMANCIIRERESEIGNCKSRERVIGIELQRRRAGQFLRNVCRPSVSQHRRNCNSSERT
jgi:hypothetical protein